MIKIDVPFVVDNKVELLCLLRHTRIQRDKLQQDMLELEERIKGGESITIPLPTTQVTVSTMSNEAAAENVTTQSAIMVLQADIAILDEMIKRMWISNG